MRPPLGHGAGRVQACALWSRCHVLLLHVATDVLDLVLTCTFQSTMTEHFSCLVLLAAQSKLKRLLVPRHTALLQPSCGPGSTASHGQHTRADPACCARAIIGQISRNAAHMAVLRRKLYMVEMWTSKRNLTPALCSKIRTFYAEIWLDHNGEPPAGDSTIQACTSAACGASFCECRALRPGCASASHAASRAGCLQLLTSCRDAVCAARHSFHLLRPDPSSMSRLSDPSLHKPARAVLPTELENDKVFGELPAVLRASVAFEGCSHLLESSSMFGKLPREVCLSILP